MGIKTYSVVLVTNSGSEIRLSVKDYGDAKSTLALIQGILENGGKTYVHGDNLYLLNDLYKVAIEVPSVSKSEIEPNATT